MRGDGETMEKRWGGDEEAMERQTKDEREANKRRYGRKRREQSELLIERLDGRLTGP